jgi:NADPH2:quinone reductase
MTKAFRFHATGGPEVLRLEDVAPREPGPGEVRMRNAAVAVNFRDILVRRGVHRVPALPSGLGLESAGTIEAVGAQVTDVAVGDRVACVAGPDGAYAEQRIVPAARVVPLRADIEARTAAAMMIRGMTARYLLHETYRVKPGDTILVHAAAGGVGLILCQWAKHLGATVIGTVGSADKAAVARQHGCDHPIVLDRNGQSTDFAAQVRALTDGRGVPVVYDSIGQATFEGSLNSLARRGVLASFGEASGDPAPIAPRRLGMLGSLYVTHPSLGDYTASRPELLATANHLFDVVASGRIKIEISREYAFADAPQAHADMEARRTTGSIVLIV